MNEVAHPASFSAGATDQAVRDLLKVKELIDSARELESLSGHVEYGGKAKTTRELGRDALTASPEDIKAALGQIRQAILDQTATMRTDAEARTTGRSPRRR